MNILKKISLITNRYDDWINYASSIKGTPFEVSQRLKAIEILIHRDAVKSQFFFDFHKLYH